jgi:hypothetical protein
MNVLSADCGKRTGDRGPHLSVLSADFGELYRRHLCRHSQYGINVIHVLSVIGVYLGLFALLYQLVQSEWVLLGITVPYLLILVFNLPFRVFVVNLLVMGLIVLGAAALPEVSWWWYLPGIVLSYKIQVWSHRIYTKEQDMTEFKKKYPKGFALFVLLSVYELPILLNYLCFGRRDWCA